MASAAANSQGLVDHRGKPCGTIRELRAAPHFFWFMRPDVPLSRETILRVRIAFGLWCVSIAALLMLLAAATGAYMSAFGRIPQWLFLTLLIAFGGGFIAFVFARNIASAHWHRTGRTRAAMLLAARGQCPSCAAWLLTTPADADGRTTCPKCSAAWKVGNTEGCPSCGYDMSAVPATAGPLAICPECATLSAANTSEDGRV